VSDEVVTRLIEARRLARRKAYENLARYKFFMFGYHAAQWVLLNHIMKDGSRNPFRPLVQLARIILKPKPEEVA
jgi:hypothetical protein